jgi:hypothetical protein
MLIHFQACVEVPDDAPLSDVEKWLAFELGVRCQLAGDNRLTGRDLVSSRVTDLQVTERLASVAPCSG